LGLFFGKKRQLKAQRSGLNSDSATGHRFGLS
jgi:hypothetical protein